MASTFNAAQKQKLRRSGKALIALADGAPFRKADRAAGYSSDAQGKHSQRLAERVLNRKVAEAA